MIHKCSMADETKINLYWSVERILIYSFYIFVCKCTANTNGLSLLFLYFGVDCMNCEEVLTCTCFGRLTLAEYHEQEEIFKLRLGHLKKVSKNIIIYQSNSRLEKRYCGQRTGHLLKLFPRNSHEQEETISVAGFHPSDFNLVKLSKCQNANQTAASVTERMQRCSHVLLWMATGVLMCWQC